PARCWNHRDATGHLWVGRHGGVLMQCPMCGWHGDLPTLALLPDPPGRRHDWPSAPWGTPEAFAHLYNESTPKWWIACEKLSPVRVRKIKAALKVFPDRPFWETVYREACERPFLQGKQPTNGYSWRPSIDALLAGTKGGGELYMKIWEGHYRPREARG